MKQCNRAGSENASNIFMKLLKLEACFDYFIFEAEVV